MELKKTISISITPRSKKESPKIKFDCKNMERYEIIGILELAIAGIKQECLSKD